MSMETKTTIKAITIYQTEDGSRFDDENKAKKYAALCDRVNEISSKLINVGRGLEYNEYIQQDVAVVKQCLSDFMDVVAEAIPDYANWALQTKNGERHYSHIGRVISDYNIKCLWRFYFRLNCIAENGREFQQPYFTTHQEEATNEVKPL